MNKVRVGVVGVGHFGRFHAENLKLLPDLCELGGVHDINPATGTQVARDAQTRFFDNVENLFKEVDAVFIATDTSSHASVAEKALHHRLHVFVEKPLAISSAEAAPLIKLAQETRRKFQVGHIERFNPAFEALRAHLGELRITHLTSRRFSAFPSRGTDVSVVHDLMIHDIDLCLTLAKSRIETLSARGEKIKSQSFDRCSAQLLFTADILADLHADRMSDRRLREFVVQTPVGQIILDLDKKEIFAIHTDLPLSPAEGWELISRNKDTHHYRLSPEAGSGNMLQCEMKAFLQAILEDKPVRVPSEEGLAALITAEKILAACRS